MKFVLLIVLIGCIIAVAIIAARYRSTGRDRFPSSIAGHLGKRPVKEVCHAAISGPSNFRALVRAQLYLIRSSAQIELQAIDRRVRS